MINLDETINKLDVYNDKLSDNIFDFNYYINNKDYQFAAAIKALLTTKDIISTYLKETGETYGDNLIRLYALLQGLFVSIDSLYQMAYSITRSKNFININSNKELRLLKYIRNDVVGHPSNRVLNSSELAFCILNEKSITKERFTYNIYLPNEINEKEVLIYDILSSYFNVSIELLDSLKNLALDEKNNNDLVSLISRVLDDYFKKNNYMYSLDKFINEYNIIYKDSAKQNRNIFRYEIILKLEKYQTKNGDEKELINYLIGLLLLKMYESIKGSSFELSLNTRNPKYISQFYRFLNKNKKLVPFISYLNDLDNPLFYNSLSKILVTAEAFNNQAVIKYLTLIKKAYKENKDELVYAFCLPIKNYKYK